MPTTLPCDINLSIGHFGADDEETTEITEDAEDEEVEFGAEKVEGGVRGARITSCEH
jgi:hypothetical protein